MYEKPPASLLPNKPNEPNEPNELKPATSIQKLSPADRVFGWVKQRGSGAYKGQLRINSVQYQECLAENPLSPLWEEGLPLTIKNQTDETKPKQNQAVESVEEFKKAVKEAYNQTNNAD